MRGDVSALLAEARKAARAVYVAVDATVADDLSRMLNGLADALEAATPKVVTETPEHPGWYMPITPALDGFWNPYYLSEDGRRIEAQPDGYHWVEPEDVVLPLALIWSSTENR